MADKRISIVFDASLNASQMSSAVKRIQSEFEKINLSGAVQKEFNKMLTQLDEAVKDFSAKAAGKEITSAKDMRELEQSFDQVMRLYKQIQTEAKSLGGLSGEGLLKILPKNFGQEFDKAKQYLGDYKRAVEKNEREIKSTKEDLSKANKKAQTQRDKKQILESKKIIEAYEKDELVRQKKQANKDIQNYKKQIQEKRAALENFEKEHENKITNSKKINKKFKDSEILQQEYDKLKADLSQKEAEVNPSLQKAIELYNKLDAQIKGSISQSDFNVNLDKITKDLQTAEKEVTDFTTKLQNLEQGPIESEKFEELRKEVEKLSGLDLSNLNPDAEGLKELEKVFTNLQAGKLQEAKEQFEKLLHVTTDMGGSVTSTKAVVDGLSGMTTEATRAAQEMERLKDQVLDFFSLSNTIQIFKNAVRDAFDTVKELDAVMTETAVVTDFSIGDMWDKLPEYANRASAMGASIKDLYSATTLYYQQGLNTNEAMGLGVETMKMARIANMDATAATEAMTAALRGFNMEINDLNAQRINDVYSELAAVTAADTSQIATAMSKTASIASAANMEFETTAAFLAQIIETTQEAPETAGTAMKTIIARFTEVKQLFDEGMLSGKDAEGEEININKIDKALKTVGISLKDFLTGSKGIDDIFLELASKWDTLDLATQRYIATTAAGSRQQSRFIAMMSNYDRTMELVNAANNSAGASQEQFGKTLDSLDAKLQKLSNAWAQFTMNLANNDVLKAGVDVLTGLIETVNSLVEALSAGRGVPKSLLSFVTVIGALKGGKSLLGRAGFPVTKDLDMINQILNSFLGKDGEEAGQKYVQNVLTGFKFGLTKNGRELLTTQITKKIFDKDSLSKAAKEEFDYLSKESSAFWSESNKNFRKNLELAMQGNKEAGIKAGLAEGDYTKTVEKTVLSLDGVATVGMAAGAAINLLSGALDAAGFDTAAEGASRFGSSLLVVSSAASALVPLLKTAGLTIPHLAVGILAISAIFTALPYVIQAVNAATPEGKLKAAEEAVTEAGKAADEATTSYKNLKDALDSLNTKYSAMDDMVEGTQQWRDALKEVNSEVLALKEQYPDLKISADSKGRLSITNAEGELEKRMITANILSASKILSEQKVQDQELANEINQLSMQLQGQSQFKGNFGKGYMAGESTAPYISNINDVLLERIAKDYYEDGASKDFDFSKYGELGEYDIEALREAATGVTSDLYQLGESIIKAESVFTKQSELRDFLSAGLGLVDLEDSKVAKSAIVEALTLQQGEGMGSMDNRINDKLAEMSASGEYDTTAEINRKFAELYGHHYTGGKIYTDASLTTEVKADDSDKKRSIAIAEVLKEFQDQATKTAKDISNEELFNAIFSEDGKFITEAMLEKYRTSINEVDVGKLAEDIGAKGFEDAIRTNINNALKDIANRKEDVKGKLGNADWKKLESKLGTNFLPLLENFYDVFDRLAQQENISKTLPQDLFGEYDSILSGLEGEAALKAAQDIDTLISNIDWSNPIQAAQKLAKEIESGSAASANFARTVQNSLSGSLLSAENQWSYFLNSEGFADVNEDLTKILQTNDEISASDITELKNEYAEFNDLLENTGINAAAAAKLLDSLKNKKIQVDELTDSLLAAMSAYGSLEGLTVDTLDKISKFDAGLNESDVNDFMKSSSDLIQENIKQGKYGNTQLLNTLDFLFGKDWDKELDKSSYEYIDKINDLSNIVLANSDNFKQSWQKLIYGTDIEGYAQTLETNIAQQVFGSGFNVDFNTDGSIEVTGFEGFSADEIALAISDALNISKEWADMMVVDFKNRSPDFAEEMNYNDLVSVLAKASLEGGMTEETALKLVESADLSEEQIEQLPDAIVQRAENLISEQEAQEEEQKESPKPILPEGFAVVKTDQEGKFSAQGTLLELAHQNQQQTSRDYLEAANLIQEGALQYEKAQQHFSELGYTEEQVASILQHVAEQLGQFEKDGKLTQLEEGQTIEQAEAVQAQAEQYKQLADAIATAFAEVPEIKLAFDESDFETFKAKLEAFCAKTYQIKVDVKPASEKGKDGGTGACCDCGGNEKAKDSKEKDFEIAPTADLSQVENEIESVLSNRTLAIDASESIATIGAQIDALVEPRTLVIWVDFDLTDEAFNYVHARGIKNSPTDHMALVSEEGPELIQTKDGFYLTGQNGPEIAHINRGDTVYTAEETRQILKPRSHKVSPRFASGYGPGTEGGGSGSSSSDEEEPWENSFDKLYNLIRQIDEEARQRERIERRYEELLKEIATSARDLIQVSREELSQLEEERHLQEKLIAERTQQLSELQKTSNMTEYAWTEINKYGEQIIRINWDLINAIQDQETGDNVSDYISKLEEWVDSINEAESTLVDIEDTVNDIKERGEDEYFDLEEKIKDAIVKARESEIEQMTEIDNSINNATSDILDSLQKTLDRQREVRKNEETETELSNLRRQLAYLQQDTSGGNDLEIKELEKQIKEGSTDYTDQLIDQKISELQKQNEKASEQRQWQIELAQAQLDQYVNSGEIWNEVYRLMNEGLDKENGLVRGSQLDKLLKNGEGYESLSKIGQMSWLEELTDLIAQGLGYLELGRQLEDLQGAPGIPKPGESVVFLKDGKYYEGILQEDGTVKVGDKKYNNVYQGYDGRFYAGENYAEDAIRVDNEGNVVRSEKKPKKNSPSSKNNDDYDAYRAWTDWEQQKAINNAKDNVKNAQEEYDNTPTNTKASLVAANKLSTATSELEALLTAIQENPNLNPAIIQHKKGGIVDYTGPSWLDGTKSKPEYVLSSVQTRSFLTLVDVLDTLRIHNFQSNAQNEKGDTFDIDINIETVREEVDVDMVAEKVQKSVVSASKYRNNIFAKR